MVRDLALLVARSVVGGGMAAHGAQKALGWFDGPGLEAAAGFMSSLGFRPGPTYAKLASYNELVSGVLIALGLGGPIGPAALISNMLVAQGSVHWKNGWFAQKNGIETGALYAAAALAFAGTDYGALSLDQLLGLRPALRHPAFTLLVLTGAIATGIAILQSRDLTPETPATPTHAGTNNAPPAPSDAPAATP